MITVTCEVKVEEKDGNPAKAETITVSSAPSPDRSSRYVILVVDKQSYRIDGYDLVSAIENCQRTGS